MGTSELGLVTPSTVRISTSLIPTREAQCADNTSLKPISPHTENKINCNKNQRLYVVRFGE
jgi:hypothetical protein